MPWKFVLFILVCILFSVFIGLNLSHSVTIDFLFAKAEAAPVFLVVLISFLAGACFGLMASLITKSKKRKKVKLRDNARAESPSVENGEHREPVAPKHHGRRRK